MDIGRRIREVREDLGMPAAELARRVGVAPNTVWRYESGEREPSMTMLEKIARELRTEPAELMRDPAFAGKGEALAEAGQDRKGPDRDEWGPDETRPKVPMPESAGHHIHVRIGEGEPKVTKKAFLEIARELREGRITPEDAWERFSA